MKESDTLGHKGIDLIMQGRDKEGRALVLEATRIENEARRQAYWGYWSQMVDHKADHQANHDPDA